ncbi:hypothetical protein ABEB36_013840 [Hypothenemus hampei]|uniref:Transcription factor Adf-1 n=1 Tax=Hypothenemus hampei TaxID=57062 RepID=A0ABD1E5N1_HYPHA
MDIDLLISEVFTRTPLWDQKDKNHHNRFILDKKWDEVAENLNTTRAIVRNKWKALRDKFRTTLASMPKSKSGAAANTMNYKGQWKFFDNLMFLKDKFAPRNHGGNFKIDEDTDNNKKEPIMVTKMNESNITPLTESSTKSSTPSSSFSSPTPAGTIAINIIKKQKRRSQNDIGSAILEIENKKLKYLEDKKIKRVAEQEDEDAAFFKTMIPFVKTLSPFDKLSYHTKIMQVTQKYMRN